MPNVLSDDGDGIAGAVGVRAFTGGSRHRGLLEVSLSALSTSVTRTSGDPDSVVRSVSYGPGIAAGYQFVGESGFTVLLSGGVGRDGGLDVEGPQFQPTIGVGVGYTVR